MPSTGGVSSLLYHPGVMYDSQIWFMWMSWSYSCDSHLHHGLGWVQFTWQSFWCLSVRTDESPSQPCDSETLLEFIMYCYVWHIKTVQSFMRSSFQAKDGVVKLWSLCCRIKCSASHARSFVIYNHNITSVCVFILSFVCIFY